MLNHDENLNTAIRYAAQLVVREDFLNSYQTAQLQKDTAPVEAIGGILSKIGAVTGDKDLMESELVMRRNILANAKRLEVTPEKWAIDFQTIAKRPKALQLFERALVIARTGIAKAPADLRDTLPDKPDFPPECSAAYRRAREHLVTNPQSPRWLALLLFTLGRAIGTNTRSSFSADEWHEGTFFWFELERAWLEGDGALVGRLLVSADPKFFSNMIASNLGMSLPTRLAETAVMAPQWALFHPPWEG